MKKLFRFVQFGANLGIITIALVLVFVVVRNYLISAADSSPKPSTNSTKQPLVSKDLAGTRLDLSGVNWNSSEKTVVLYLSTTCGYCTQSVPFYRRLIQNKPEDIKTVAVFLQNREMALKYLEKHKLAVDEVVSDSLDTIGVSGTPIILVVDRNGVISETWRGKLTEEKETEFINKIAS